MSISNNARINLYTYILYMCVCACGGTIIVFTESESM